MYIIKEALDANFFENLRKETLVWLKNINRIKTTDQYVELC